MQSLVSRSSQVTAVPRARRTEVQRRVSVPPRAIPLNVLFTIAERTGQVEAGIEVPIIAGIVVALAGTAAIPLLLKPGQEAADSIFTGERKGKSTSVKPGKRK